MRPSSEKIKQSRELNKMELFNGFSAEELEILKQARALRETKINKTHHIDSDDNSELTPSTELSQKISEKEFEDEDSNIEISEADILEQLKKFTDLQQNLIQPTPQTVETARPLQLEDGQQPENEALESIKHSLEGLLLYKQKWAQNDENPKIVSMIHETLAELEKHHQTPAQVMTEVEDVVLHEMHADFDHTAKSEIESEKIVMEKTVQDAENWNDHVLTEEEKPRSAGITSDTPLEKMSKRMQIAKEMNLVEQVMKVDNRNAKFNLYLKQKHGQTSELKKRLPKMIVIGVKKCGTGALTNFLDMHPRARYAGELYYFNREIETKSINWYEAKMPDSFADDIVFEKTPDYLFDKDVPAAIKEFNPHTKIIVVLCDPVKRVFSDFLHMNRFNDTGRDVDLFKMKVDEGMEKIGHYMP